MEKAKFFFNACQAEHDRKLKHRKQHWKTRSVLRKMKYNKNCDRGVFITHLFYTYC